MGFDIEDSRTVEEQYRVKENDDSNVRKCVGLYMTRNEYNKILSGKWIEFLEALGRQVKL